MQNDIILYCLGTNSVIKKNKIIIISKNKNNDAMSEWLVAQVGTWIYKGVTTTAHVTASITELPLN